MLDRGLWPYPALYYGSSLEVHLKTTPLRQATMHTDVFCRRKHP
jgi:hypothetical protein